MKLRSRGVGMIWLIACALLAPPAATAKAKMDKALSGRLSAYLQGKKAAVLLEDGLPGDAAGPSFSGGVGVKIEDGGAWEQKKFLGIKLSTASRLSRGEVLVVESFKVKKDGLEVKTNTAEAVLCVDSTKTDNPELIDYQGLDFDFRFSEQYMANTQDNYDFIVASVEKYIKLCESPDDASDFSRGLRAGGADSDAASRQKPQQGSLEEQLREVLGPSHYSVPKAVMKLRKGMTCAQVKEIHPGLDVGKCKEEGYSFLKIVVAGNPLIAGYEFTFKDKALTDVTLVFNRSLKKVAFKEASAAALQAKWGRKKASDLANDIITWTWTDGAMGQRSYHVDRWVITYRFSDRGEEMSAMAPIKDAETLTRRLAALLGPSHQWLTPLLKDVRQNMTCEAVHRILPDLNAADCLAGETEFVQMDVGDDPLVSHYKFFFSNGRLRTIEIIFQRYLDKSMFQDVSNRVLQAKWGRQTEAKMAEPFVSWSDFELALHAHRSYSVDHWELSISPPKDI
jgi:hypothetical protein